MHASFGWFEAGSIPVPPTLYSMDQNEIKAIYMLQSENVRHLVKVLHSLNREINAYIQRNNDHEIAQRTKILALVYSAWSEAQFLQIAFTPNGFKDTEITAIKTEKNSNGITAGWNLMIDKAMARVTTSNFNEDLVARATQLASLVGEFIGEPSVIRNKIAHGQWARVLNRPNTAENTQMTEALRALDPVIICRQQKAHQYFGFIVRDLVQSPTNGFHQHYWTNIVNLEQFLEKSKDWTITTKRLLRKRKPGNIGDITIGCTRSTLRACCQKML